MNKKKARTDGRRVARVVGAAWVAALLVTAGAGAQSGDAAAANGKISLDGTSTPATAAQPVATPPAASATPQAPAAPAASPTIEASALGVPNGALSARPIEPEPEKADRVPWLERIDPRQNEIVRVGGALLVVIVLLFLTRTMLRRAGGVMSGAGRPSGVVDVLGRFPVARGQHLVLLKIARRIVLVHQTGSTMTTLAEVSDPEEVAALLSRVEAGSRGRHADKFRSMLKRFETEHESARRRNGRGAIPEGEVVDLTQRDNGLRRLLANGARA